MKLIRLRSIANNAIRESLWTPEPIGEDPFYWFAPKEKVVIDLVKGELNPDMKGDSVQKFYKAMSRWFHQALKKEGISIEVIDSAKILVTPKGKECIIIAQGRTFKSRQVEFKPV